jgi:hypothetical protein
MTGTGYVFDLLHFPFCRLFLKTGTLFLGRQVGFQPALVRGRLFKSAQHRCQQVEQGGAMFGAFPVDPVVHPNALAPVVDEAGIAERGKVARHARLRQIEGGDDVTDAQLTAPDQKRHDPQPGLLAEGPEYLCCCFHENEYIRINEYIATENNGREQTAAAGKLFPMKRMLYLPPVLLPRLQLFLTREDSMFTCS